METTIQFCIHILFHPILCLEQKPRFINSTIYEEATLFYSARMEVFNVA